MTRTDGCLVNELPVKGLYSQELGENIIEREEPISSCCWEVGFAARLHGRFSTLSGGCHGCAFFIFRIKTSA